MRTSILWKMLIPSIALTVITPVQAQTSTTPAIPTLRPRNQNRPTDAQQAQLDFIQGVGPIKFGATVESFGKDVGESVKDLDSGQDFPADQISLFHYLKAKDITWGTLHPSSIELKFRYNQLVAIRLKFEETQGDLLMVQRALKEKYGPTMEQGNIYVGGGTSNGGLQWTAGRIRLVAVFPGEWSVAAVTDLDKKSSGIVQLSDDGLWSKQSREKLEEAQKKMAESHDLEKIKADL